MFGLMDKRERYIVVNGTHNDGPDVGKPFYIVVKHKNERGLVNAVCERRVVMVELGSFDEKGKKMYYKLDCRDDGPYNVMSILTDQSYDDIKRLFEELDRDGVEYNALGWYI